MASQILSEKFKKLIPKPFNSMYSVCSSLQLKPHECSLELKTVS